MPTVDNARDMTSDAALETWANKLLDGDPLDIPEPQIDPDDAEHIKNGDRILREMVRLLDDGKHSVHAGFVDPFIGSIDPEIPPSDAPVPSADAALLVAPPAPDDVVIALIWRDLQGNRIATLSGLAIPYADLIAGIGNADRDLCYAYYSTLLDGDVVIVGSADDDRALEAGSGGVALVSGGDGDDKFRVWHPKDVVYDGGDGTDVLVFEPSRGATPTPPAGAVVNLATGIGTNPFGGTLILSHIENVGGTSNNDSLTGDDGDNVLESGLSGADTINGGGGNDTVVLGSNVQGAHVDGGPGMDQLVFSAEGSAQITILDLLNPGLNTGAFQGATIAGFEAYRATAFINFYSFDFRGSDAGESAFGTLGNDHLQGRGGNDTLIGIAGNDTFDGGDGLDTADYSISSFPVSVDLEAGTATGTDNGTDTLISIERVVGTRADDTFHGGLGTDSLDGGSSGIDTLVFTGTMAAHTIASGNGVVTVSGADGTHFLTGIDKLQFADQTVDTPLFVAIAPVAQTEGDSGTTNLAFLISLSRPTTSTVMVTATTADGTAEAGSDYTAESHVVTFTAGNYGSLFLVPITGDMGLEGNETLTVTLSSPVGVELGATTVATGTIIDDDQPAEAMVGTAESDLLVGGNGADTLFGQASSDLLQGGDGNDVILGNDGDDTIFGGNGNDLITGDLGFAPGNDSINAGPGNDTVLVQDGADTVLGGDGDDLIGIFAGADQLIDGGAGTDIIIGGFDIFGAANATIVGGAGSDILVGGQFNDTFVYHDGFGPSDLIYLFTPGTDKIRLEANINGTGIAAPSDVLAHIAATALDGIGPVAAITLGPEIIYVVGVTTLQAGDFVIA